MQHNPGQYREPTREDRQKAYEHLLKAEKELQKAAQELGFDEVTQLIVASMEEELPLEMNEVITAISASKAEFINRDIKTSLLYDE